MPLLSIIIPVFNAERTIRRALDSIRALPEASRRELEVLAIDDGSTDNSRAVIESVRDLLSPASLVLLSQPNQGSSVARNSGISRSTGNWLFFLDADDELGGDLLPELKAHHNASAVAFTVQYIRDGSPSGTFSPPFITPGNHIGRFSAGNALTISSMAIKRSAISSFFDASMLFLEDWLFWIENPRVFADQVVVGGRVSARVHVHSSGKTASYAQAGRYRVLIAQRVLKEFQGRLTRIQENNFSIHQQIGKLLQGDKLDYYTLCRFPCSISLHLKLWTYWLLKNKFRLFDRYGQRA